MKVAWGAASDAAGFFFLLRFLGFFLDWDAALDSSSGIGSSGTGEIFSSSVSIILID